MHHFTGYSPLKLTVLKPETNRAWKMSFFKASRPPGGIAFRLVFPVRRRHLAMNGNGSAVGVSVIAMTSALGPHTDCMSGVCLGALPLNIF